MDILFRTNKSLIRMDNRLDVKNQKGNFLTTSSLDGSKETIIARYETEEKALEILNRIDKIIDTAINKNKDTISIDVQQGGKNEIEKNK